jgi:hypothetical protein
MSLLWNLIPAASIVSGLWYARKVFVKAKLENEVWGQHVPNGEAVYVAFFGFMVGLFWPVTFLILLLKKWFNTPVVKVQKKEDELKASIAFWEEYRAKVTREKDITQRDLANTVLRHLRNQL